MRKNLTLTFFILTALTLSGGGAVYAAMGDLVFERKSVGAAGASAIEPSIFPHWVHRVRYRCYVCHPAPFIMEQGANEVTMAAIEKGEYCGLCHNGTVAFKVEFKACARCHREPPK